jgi:flagellar motor switch protein FliM
VNSETIAPSAQTASLISSAQTAPTFPVLDRVGDRFARILGGVISEFGVEGGRITALEGVVQTYGGWRSDAATSLAGICRFRVNPMKGAALMRMPAPFICQLVDRFYGGNGEAGADRVSFSTAENRFVQRIGERGAAMMATAWSDVVSIHPELTTVSTDWADIDFVRESDLVVVQSFVVSGGGMTPAEISVVYPVDALRTIGQRSAPAASPEPSVDDLFWQEKLTLAVLETRLSLRAVFARPELPFAQLLTLKAGDIIPISLPTHVPVTVAGQLFAAGTVGEANGRVAIQINSLKEGTNHE